MAGSVTKTEKKLNYIKEIKFEWTSDASGDVSAATNDTTEKQYTGEIIGLITVPNVLAAPDNNYDIEITNGDGVDLLLGFGSNRDSNNTQSVQGNKLGWVVQSQLSLTVANAGNAKQGTVYVYIK